MFTPEEQTHPPHGTAGHQPDGRTETARRTRGDGRRYLAGTAGALVLAAGLGGAAVAQGSASVDTGDTVQPSAQTDDEIRTSSPRAGRSDTQLEDLTLDQLADELERLGLELRIGPSDTEDDYQENRNDGQDGDVDQDSDVDQDGAVGDPWIDPFEGMTEQEIFDLSDEEYEALLDKAGIDLGSIEEDPNVDGVDDRDDGTGTDDDRPGNDDDGYGEEPEPLATIEVDGDKIDSAGLSPEVARQAAAIWERFVELIPADQRRMVANFELMPKDYQGAHVYPTDDDPTKWNLGVAVGLGEDRDYVLIHEFGHLLTLQAKEVPPGDDTESCPTYHTGEGCALKGSTFARFVAAFWPQELQDRLTAFYEAEDYDAIEEFYNENKDKFVTDYAASNPGEDLAETFAVFVTKDRPTGNTVADQKVNLLWADEDMVKLRDQIRAVL